MAVAALAAAVVLSAGRVPVAATPETGAPLGQSCPALYLLGVQGADETSPDAAATTDTGALGPVFAPVSAAVPNLVQHAYIPFGGSDIGEPQPYDAAVDAASQRLDTTAAEVVTRCVATKIAAVGYAHGAPAVASWAERVGAGTAHVTAEQVAAVALMANPHRATGAPVLPGRPNTSTPAPVPGTAGTNVASIQLTISGATGAGISAAAQPNYGALTGRIADLCVAGDATCDTPSGSPLAATAANITARSDLRDPIAAISTIAQALSATVFGTAVGVINEDLTGNSLDQLSYQPAKPLGQRLAEASNPATAAPTGNDALAALMKLGTIGLNTVISIAQKVITPATIAELATVGMANPWAALGVLAGKVGAAAMELIPPQTGLRWINEAFTAITSTVTDQRELYALASTAQYSDTSGRHSSYQTTPATPDGRSATAAIAAWLTAAARDLAPITPSSVTPKPPNTVTLAPSTTATPPITSPAATASPSTTSGRRGP
ncbi:cutinase family protein [Nocardia sp. NPDC052566]|uniref:cutinase family protein n=1 Tax=Nocardia sp. NPDC052566 TaxID=3364330 RepID=UPI0037CA97B4